MLLGRTKRPEFTSRGGNAAPKVRTAIRRHVTQIQGVAACPRCSRAARGGSGDRCWAGQRGHWSGRRSADDDADKLVDIQRRNCHPGRQSVVGQSCAADRHRSGRRIHSVVHRRDGKELRFVRERLVVVLRPDGGPGRLAFVDQQRPADQRAGIRHGERRSVCGRHGAQHRHEREGLVVVLRRICDGHRQPAVGEPRAADQPDAVSERRVPSDHGG